MAEAKNSNFGSSSHLGEDQVARDAHFVFDYTKRRVPMPFIGYLAVADTVQHSVSGENAGKRALDLLREYIDPAAIPEEDANSEAIKNLIKESLHKISAELQLHPEEGKSPEVNQASVTLVLADRKQAYIGHIGTNRVFLLHQERLYDLTPTGELTADVPAPTETPPLFASDGQGESGGENGGEKGDFLGQSRDVKVGYNEVEIVPGDTIILESDGMWRHVSEAEVAESALSAMNMQRNCSRLTRLAFSQDSSDNATMVGWKYVVPEIKPGASEEEKRSQDRKERATDALLVTLLILVLCGIFAVGFAFGWKITDAIRKPQTKTEPVQTTDAETEESKEVEEEKEEESPEEEKENGGEASTLPATATIDGEGVRMRTSPDATSSIVGLLKKGQSVAILGEATGTDGKRWIKIGGTVRSSGEDIKGEGYVRADYLDLTGGTSP